MELLLLRPGKARKSDSLAKRQWPLKDRGKRNAQRLGAWLQARGIQPEQVLCSPAERAWTCAEKCVKAMGEGVQLIQLEPLLLGAEPGPLLHRLAQAALPMQRLMLVGRRSLLEGLARLLIPAEQLPMQRPLLPPGGLLRIALTAKRSQPWTGQGCLLERIEPAMLPRTFPVLVDGRIEQRPRPAYYYRQSAIMPYRWVEEELQLLLVTSSSGRRWVIPKGIVEPGLSEAASAAREAREEAGAIGQLLPTPVGEYSHEKWGGSCRVLVYAMAVEELQERSAWQENHRQRCWCSIQQAQQRVESAQLAQLIGRFGQSMEARRG